MSQQALQAIDDELARLDRRRGKLLTAREALMALDVEEVTAGRESRTPIPRGPKGRPRTPHAETSPRKTRAAFDAAALESSLEARVMTRGQVTTAEMAQAYPDVKPYRVQWALTALVKARRIAKVNAGRRGQVYCRTDRVEDIARGLAETYVRHQRKAGAVARQVRTLPKPRSVPRPPDLPPATATPTPPVVSRETAAAQEALAGAIRAKLRSGASYTAQDIYRAARQTIAGLEPAVVVDALEALAREQTIVRIPSEIGGVPRYRARAKGGRS